MEKYLSQITCASVVEEIGASTGLPRDRITEMLQVYVGEARFGYSLVLPHLRHGDRILEVGSGLGLLSGYLMLQGYNITPLEPCANGFDLFAQILATLVKQGHAAPSLCVKAEELCPEKNGHYDFIYSVNVLEHIPKLEEAMAGMTSVLGDGGHMLHTCPNYTVPYEPHFGLPLIPFFPRTTRWLLPKKIGSSELWQSLNFVTITRMRRIAAATGCVVTFRRGMMLNSLERLGSDVEFASRHRGITPIFRVLKAIRFLKVLGVLPPELDTPMIAEFHKAP